VLCRDPTSAALAPSLTANAGRAAPAEAAREGTKPFWRRWALARAHRGRWRVSRDRLATLAPRGHAEGAIVTRRSGRIVRVGACTARPSWTPGDASALEREVVQQSAPVTCQSM
jgi:hypothetical protein